jgi:hypothetical protein
MMVFYFEAIYPLNLLVHVSDNSGYHSSNANSSVLLFSLLLFFVLPKNEDAAVSSVVFESWAM